MLPRSKQILVAGVVLISLGAARGDEIATPERKNSASTCSLTPRPKNCALRLAFS